MVATFRSDYVGGADDSKWLWRRGIVRAEPVSTHIDARQCGNLKHACRQGVCGTGDHGALTVR